MAADKFRGHIRFGFLTVPPRKRGSNAVNYDKPIDG
jgi:hypothetical protein